MSKSNLSTIWRGFQKAVVKHSPEILTGIGIAGMVTTTILAVKATPKALELIEDKKQELEVEELTPVETVKATWKCYAPAGLTCAASIACIIGASSVHLKRNATLAAAYKISETARTEFRKQVIETVGEKKEKEIRDKVSEKQIEDNPISTSQVVIVENDKTLFYEPLTGRYFNSDTTTIKDAELTIREKVIADAFSDGQSLNDFFYEIGLESVDVGDSIGWSIEKGNIKLDIYYKSTNKGPLGVIQYDNPPVYGFRG